MRNPLSSFITILIFIFLFLLPSPLYAFSEYVLPYPSFMPGSKFYTIHLFWENVMNYWHFGSFSQFKYNLSLSDKYLVEAKTLFEYKQYYLGYNALKKSNSYFKEASLELVYAKNQNKNISQKQNVLRSAASKHTEVLDKVREIIPEAYLWQEEKMLPVNINLYDCLDEANVIRKQL